MRIPRKRKQIKRNPVAHDLAHTQISFECDACEKGEWVLRAQARTTITVVELKMPTNYLTVQEAQAEDAKNSSDKMLEWLTAEIATCDGKIEELLARSRTLQSAAQALKVYRSQDK